MVRTKNNEGTIELMEKQAPLLQYRLIGIEDVTLHGNAVSSTRIREAIKNGDFNLTAELLGRNYSVFLKADKKDRSVLKPFLFRVALPNNGEYPGTLVNLKSHQEVNETVKVSGNRIETDEVMVNEGTLYRFIFDTSGIR